MTSPDKTDEDTTTATGEGGAEHRQSGNPEAQSADLSAAPAGTESPGLPSEHLLSGKISDFLKPSRIALDLDTSSRKRLFEYLSEIAAAGPEEISEDDVFKILTERERLGCTGLGRGIAVPHGRIENLSQPVIALIRLKHPIDYDAPDDRPVWLAVGLLVPIDANDTHLKLLSKLAGCFQDETFVTALKGCATAESVVALFDERE